MTKLHQNRKNWTIKPVKILLNFSFEISLVKRLLLVLLMTSNLHTFAQCGLDIFVINDQSGSVDATENTQSREFIAALAIQLDPLGTTSGESRVSVSEFASLNTWQRYSFPIAGTDYTTNLSDVVAYQYDTRTLSGGTSVANALLEASSQINISAISGRTSPKVIVLMTDASCSQIESNSVSIADQLRAQGFHIVVMAIGPAASCPILSSVADVGGLFTASDYSTLQNNTITFIDQIVSAACTFPPYIPAYDLSINITSFTATGCSPGPGTYTVNYTVTNNGDADFNSTLITSFYNANPTTVSANYLMTQNDGVQLISAGGATFNGSFSSASLAATSTLFGVTNLDGASVGNEVPLPFQLTASQLADTSETITYNNFSTGRNRTNGVGCAPKALLTTSVSNSGVGCGDNTSYEVMVCNNGNSGALIDSLIGFPDANFILLSQSGGCDSSFSAGWEQLGLDIEGVIAEDRFGSSVSISSDGNRIAISGTQLSTTVTGYVEVYDWNGSSWIMAGSRITGGIGDWFGNAISLSADGMRLAITAPFNDDGGTNSGKVEVYEWNGVAWLQLGLDLYGENSPDHLGWGSNTVSLSSDGSRLAVGSVFNDDGGSSAGQAQIYEWNGAAWNQIGADIEGDIVGHRLGASVYLTSDGNRVAILAGTNSVGQGYIPYVEVYDWDGSAWIQVGTDIIGEGIDDIGSAVVLSSDGNRLAFGARANDGNGGSSGHTRAYEWNGSAWIQMGMDIDGENAGDRSGISISLSSDGSRLGIGATGNDGNGSGSGHIRIYDWNGSAWIQVYDDIDGEAAGESFGAVRLSSDGSRLIGGAYLNDDNAINSGKARVYELISGCLLPPGECDTYYYTYDVSGAGTGTYDFSAAVSATKAVSSDDDPVIFPDTNFSAGASSNLDGFDGTMHSEDNVTVPASSPACLPGNQVSIAVDIPDATGCEAGYTTATVTITNTSGIAFNSALLSLNLSGTGFIYASEPYNFTGGLVLPSIDIFNPAYPAVANALNGSNGTDTLAVYTLPAGTSTFDIDILIGNGLGDLSAQVIQLPPGWNTGDVSNTDSDTTGITGEAQPSISGTCPAAITAATTTISLNYTVTAATTIQWTSSTGGTFTAPNAGTTDYTVTAADIANSFADFTLFAASASGCDATALCRVNITGVSYDYGDAPSTYDLGATTIVIAGASTTLSGLHLGAIPPDTEANTQPTADASGDGADEDGLSSTTLPAPSSSHVGYQIPVQVTNTTAQTGYLTAFIDWNEDGDYLDTLESSTSVVTIAASSGFTTVNALFDAPATIPTNPVALRLRISTDSALIAQAFSLSPEGEIEDFFVSFASLDYGDAPASYGDPTHVIDDNYMGSGLPDADTQTQNTGNGGTDGTGDDTDGNNDEDLIIPALTLGQTSIMYIPVVGEAILQGWIDWNGDGDFADAGEQIATDIFEGLAGDGDATANGIIQLSVSVPANATTSLTYVRFRVSSSTGLNATDAAFDGEVEDYQVTVNDVIPFPCSTSLVVNPNFDKANNYFGTYPGPGVPITYKTSVDGVTEYIDGNNNINGLNFTGWFRPGDRSEDWSEGQYVRASNERAHAETPALVSLSPVGGGFMSLGAPDEVISQDIIVTVGQIYKFQVWLGILPIYNDNNKDTDGTPGIDPDAGILNKYDGRLQLGIVSGGVVLPGFTTLGTQIDAAGAVDLTGTSPYIRYDVLTDFPITYTAADFPANLPAYDPSEIYSTYPTLDPHWQLVEIEFEATSTVATLQMKETTGWGIFGLDGADAFEVCSEDYGDAPDTAVGTAAGNYETLSANGGPSHTIINGLEIGTAPDGDIDAFADGTDANNDGTDDDTEGTADEGSITFGTLTSADVSYTLSSIAVTNTTGGNATLFGWIDFDLNGSFDEDELATATVAIGATTANLTWASLPGIITGTTYARFRIAAVADLTAGSDGGADEASLGAAASGEVEDYQVTIVQSCRVAITNPHIMYYRKSN